MDFSLESEQQMLSDSLTRLLRDTYPIERRNAGAQSDTGFDAEIWSTLAELGAPAALLTEDQGGLGGSGIDLMVVFQALGQALVVEPMLGTVLAAPLLAELASEAQQALLEPIVEGTHLITLAHGEPDSRFDMSRVSTTAKKTADGWRLTGQKAVVPHGDTAHSLVVSARTGGGVDDEQGISLFLVPADTAGLIIRGVPGIDGHRSAEIRLDGVTLPADAVLGPVGSAYPALEKALARGTLALSAEALGAMEVARDMTLDYLKTRTQFGQPIGKFQALQHRMAEMCIEIEQVTSAVILAAGRLDAGRRDREQAVSAAKCLAGRVGKLVAEEVIQMHGGIGMSWELALPHYAKRLTMIDHLLGDEDHHVERFMLAGRWTDEESRNTATTEAA